MYRRLIVLVVFCCVLLSAASVASAVENPDVIKLKKNLEIPREMVVNDVIVVDGNLTVLGRVEGNVVVVGGVVTLKSGSYVGGSVMVVGEIIKDSASQVTGKITQVYIPRFIPPIIDLFKGGWVALWAAISLLALLGFICLSVLVIALAPSHIGVVVSGLERSFFIMFLWGLVWTMMVVPIALFLIISIVGIALIPLEILLVALGLFAGYISSAIFIGNKISALVNRPFAPFASAIVGLIILFVVGLIPIAGAMVKSIFLIAGYGAVVTSRFGTFKDKEIDIAWPLV